MKFALRYALLGSLVCGAAVAAEVPAVPNLGPDLPAVEVRCGEVGLALRRASQWTPSRIDFRGIPMTTQHSAYGTVLLFPEIGFIGTGHLENEPEPLDSLAWFLDGEEIFEPGSELAGKRFRFVRESTIRDFRLRCEIEVRDDLLFETTTLRADADVPLQLLYHFMHAWTPTVSAWLAGGGEDDPAGSSGGTFLDTEEEARKFHIRRRVDWVAVYEPVSGQFAVSRLLAAPESGGHVSKIWNVPGTYRKYYLKCFEKETVPAGFEGTWRMVTGFGAAAPEEWEDAARDLAAELSAHALEEG